MSADIIRWPKHLWHGPRHHAPGDPALDFDNCMCCALSVCVVCNGAEASLPTDCPGETISNADENAIIAGNLDYTLVRGWHDPLTVRGKRK